LTVPTSSGCHVKKGEDPRHKELRKSEQIRPVYFTEYLSLHHIGKPAHQDGEGEIVDNEKNRRQEDESGLCAEELLELGIGGDSGPVGDVIVFLRR